MLDSNRLLDIRVRDAIRGIENNIYVAGDLVGLFEDIHAYLQKVYVKERLNGITR